MKERGDKYALWSGVVSSASSAHSQRVSEVQCVVEEEVDCGTGH